MKYRIEWYDTTEGKQKKLTVHSLRAVSEVKDTLSRQPWRHENLSVTEICPTRFVDVIIKFER